MLYGVIPGREPLAEPLGASAATRWGRLANAQHPYADRLRARPVQRFGEGSLAGRERIERAAGSHVPDESRATCVPFRFDSRAGPPRQAPDAAAGA